MFIDNIRLRRQTNKRCLKTRKRRSLVRQRKGKTMIKIIRKENGIIEAWSDKGYLQYNDLCETIAELQETISCQDNIIKSFTEQESKFMEKLHRRNLQIADLKKKIVEWEQQISVSEKDLEGDEVLADLKEQVKDREDVYKSSTKMHNAMIRFAVYLLESRGAT